MYQTFYNLSGKPFRLSPDPSFFFPSRGHKRALAYLRYGLNQDEGFVVITGAPGTGKTTLAKILLQELGDKNLVVAHLTTSQLEADDMLRMVSASFGLRYEGLEKAALLKSLEQFLLARARERKRALVVIDEAQNLPERSLEELRMLSNLQVGDKALVQTFLLGQAQFRQMLDHPDLEQLRQRVIANYHLSPLAPDECQRYIESRMHQVGWDDDPHFAEVAYEMIHEYTEGIPRRINMLCDRILLYSCMEELHDITGEVVKLVIEELENEISGKLVSPEVEILDDEEDLLLTTADAKQSSGPETQKADKALSNAKDSTTHAKRIEELSEKAEKEIAGNFKIKESAESMKVSDSEVMGNTVTKTKPDASETADNKTSVQTEIDERDLFRVIPGGKTDSIKPSVEGGAYSRPMTPAAQAQPTQEDVALRRILRLVLAFHRSPSRFPGLDNPNQPLPDGITELLELAVSDDQTLTRVSPAAVMGISPMMLRAAVRFFVRRAFFVLDGDDYRVLGLPPHTPQPLIERHYDLLMRLLRQDKQRGSADSVARIGNAYEALGRLDQAVQTKQGTLQSSVIDADDELEIIIEENGNDGLTIDFDQITTHHSERRESVSPFGKKPHETFNPETAIAHRNLRRVGQIAVLGFGALVIVLGMYIVQIGPSDVSKPKANRVKIAQNFDNENASNSTQHLPLPLPPENDKTSTSEPSTAADASPKSNQHSDVLDKLIGTSSQSNQTQATASTQFEDDQSDDTLNKVLSKPETRRLPLAAKAHEGKKDRVASVSVTQKAAPTTTTAKSDTVKHKAAQQQLSASTSKQTLQKPNDTVVSKKVASNQHASKPVVTTVKATVMPRSYPGVDIDTSKKAANVSVASSTDVAKIQPVVSKPTEAISQQTKAQLSATSQPAIQGSAGSGVSTSSGVVPPVVTTPTATIAANQPASVTQTTPAVPQQAKISNGELNGLISRFTSAYKKGDINKIMALFAPNARTNNRTNLTGIRSDYMDLFKTTNSRDISIDSIFWEFDNQFARGVGDFRARVKPSGSTKPQTFIGKVTIQVVKQGNDLEMTRFYFSNQKVIAESGGSAAASSPANAQTAAISKIEMQNAMTQFIQYYEQGDINGLMSLFANDARTNDQTTRAGIRKDYLDLFNGTTSRQFTLSNLTWKGSNNTVTGFGNFEVVVKGKGSKTPSIYTGTINIEARRSNGQILLTKWLHNVK